LVLPARLSQLLEEELELWVAAAESCDKSCEAAEISARNTQKQHS
jgi:hypothetical protein